MNTFLNELKTPSLILDIDRVRVNAERMSKIVHRNGVRLRPHIKTHKCVEVAKIQTAGHDGAITVSTLAEASAFAKHGFNDITYAVPIETGKFAEAVGLRQNGIELALLTDDAETAKALDEAAGKAGVKFSVFLKVDCGYHRCGVTPDTPEALAIPRILSDATNLLFAGILTHAGHSYDVKSVDGVREIASIERDLMAGFADLLRGDGIEVPTVSIGSTPTISLADHLLGIDEVRPGNYIFYDAYQATLGSCRFEDCALEVLAAVIHRDPARRRLVIDAGGIALSKDTGARHLDPQCGYGRVRALDGDETGMRIAEVSQEHGEIDVDEQVIFDRFKVGDRVRVLANHSCLTAAQHSHYNVLENDRIVDRWEIHRGW